jgi:hypothetical protein
MKAHAMTPARRIRPITVGIDRLWYLDLRMGHHCAEPPA